MVVEGNRKREIMEGKADSGVRLFLLHLRQTEVADLAFH